MTIRKLLFIGSMFLVGCATTTTGPTPAGQGKFVMSRQEGAFPSGSEPLMQEVLQQAGSFCRSLGKEINLIESTENSGPFIMGNYPKATIVFECRSN